MSADVFILSSACDPNPAMAIWQAAEQGGIGTARVQDAVFGLESASGESERSVIMEAAGLTCPSAAVLSPLRALFFSAASMLGDDASLSVVVGMEGPGFAAVVLASPESVGVMNLLPRARLAARSLSGAGAALRVAGIGATDLEVSKQGDSLIVLHDLLDALESESARWGMISSGELTLLIERI